MTDESNQPENGAAGRLGHLVRSDQAVHNPRYSRIIRRARLILPVIALGLIAVIFVWSDIRNNNIIPAADPAKITKTVGKNELVNPRFESIDSENQPYTVTAKRAVQNEADENLVMMDSPVADILLNSGNWLALKSERGSFRQDTHMLLLRGKVVLFHDKGYQLETEQLDMNLKANTAKSQANVHAKGPEGTLQSKGLEGMADEGRIIFGGPAKLVLTNMSGDTGGMFEQ